MEAIWYPPTIRVNSQNRNFTRALRLKVIRYGESLKNTEVMTTILSITYIDEVMSINGLTSDQIHAGQYLTVAYYDTQAR